MSTLSNTKGSLQDLANMMGANEQILSVVELLSRENAILMDMPFIEGNQTNGHRTVVRDGLPTAIWRRYYEGVAPSKGKNIQVTDTSGSVHTLFEVDYELAKINNFSRDWFFDQSKAHAESLNQAMATTLFYGDSTEPEKFLGLAPRYNAYYVPGTTSVDDRAYNVINGGGTGSDNTSVWLVGWGKDKTTGFVPKGSSAGINYKEPKEEWANDGSGNPYEVYRGKFSWDLGLTVQDWRSNGRICNIDQSSLSADASTGTNLITSMIRLIHHVRSNGANQVFYVNRDIYEYLDWQTYNNVKSSTVMYGKDIHGQEVMKFRGIPVRLCEAILNTETAVSADS